MSQPWLAYLPVYIAFALPILAAAAILVGRMIQPYFRGQWLIAVLSILVTWGLVFTLRPQTARVVPLLSWQPQNLFPATPFLLIDSTSWAYALALTTVAVAILMTAPERFSDVSWLAWFGTLSFTGLGLMAVWAGNPLTLLIAWTSLDILELLVQLSQVSQSSLRERLVAAFSARVTGTLVLILAVVIASAQGADFDFQSFPASIAPLLILVAGLRLSVLPVQSPLFQEIPLRRGVGTALRMVPAAASLVLLTRTAAVGVQPGLGIAFLILAGLSAFYSGLAWLNSADELGGRVFWMQGFSAMAVAAAVQGRPAAALAWGMAILLSGGMLFLHSARRARLDTLVYLGLLTASAFPMSPTWAGTFIFSPQEPRYLGWYILVGTLFLVALNLLLLGFVRHLIRPVEPISGIQPWVWLVYVPGLLILPAVQIWLGWLNLPPLAEFPYISWWIGPIVLVVMMVSFIMRRFVRAPAPLQDNLRQGLAWGATFWGQALSLAWVYRFLWSAYRQVSRFLYAITRLLEGEGGLLWALLLFILIFSIFLPANAAR